jgi:hypothetical protein
LSAAIAVLTANVQAMAENKAPRRPAAKFILYS